MTSAVLPRFIVHGNLTETLINLDTEKFCKIWFAHVGIMLAKNVNVVLVFIMKAFSRLLFCETFDNKQDNSE